MSKRGQPKRSTFTMPEILDFEGDFINLVGENSNYVNKKNDQRLYTKKHDIYGPKYAEGAEGI